MKAVLGSTEVLEALADAFGAAEQVIRKRIARVAVDRPVANVSEVLQAVRAEHPLLGPRQAQIVELLSEAGDDGMNTGGLSKRMQYDQPNVYLTLQVLREEGFVEKDETVSPHIYRLAVRFRAGRGDAA